MCVLRLILCWCLVDVQARQSAALVLGALSETAEAVDVARNRGRDRPPVGIQHQLDDIRVAEYVIEMLSNPLHGCDEFCIVGKFCFV